MLLNIIRMTKVASRVWNSLSNKIKSSETVNIFKQHGLQFRVIAICIDERRTLKHLLETNSSSSTERAVASTDLTWGQGGGAGRVFGKMYTNL